MDYYEDEDNSIDDVESIYSNDNTEDILDDDVLITEGITFSPENVLLSISEDYDDILGIDDDNSVKTSSRRYREYPYLTIFEWTNIVKFIALNLVKGEIKVPEDYEDLFGLATKNTITIALKWASHYKKSPIPGLIVIRKIGNSVQHIRPEDLIFPTELEIYNEDEDFFTNFSAISY
jgi:hypothetical protein